MSGKILLGLVCVICHTSGYGNEPMKIVWPIRKIGVNLVSMRVGAGTDAIYIGHNDCLSTFGYWFIRKATPKTRSSLAIASVPKGSLVTTEVQRCKGSDCIHIVDDHFPNQIVLVCRVVALFSFLWGSLVIAELGNSLLTCSQRRWEIES